MINLEEMFLEFKLLGKEALAMNHYDLEATSMKNYTASDWREFLDNPKIREYIKKETDIIRAAQVNKIVQNAGTSKSVGQAQLLSALTKLDEDTSEAEGPIFVYCYVPLNEEQQHAENIMEVDEFGKPT